VCEDGACVDRCGPVPPGQAQCLPPAPCDEPCDCYLNPDLEFREPCPLLCPQCGSYWACEEGLCAEKCGRIPFGQDQCPAPLHCRANTDCGEGEFCDTPPGSCRTTGTCRPRPEACPLDIDPVCGCDGRTYDSACAAAAAGTGVASRGPCGDRCGTIAGFPCPPGEFCEFPVDTCGIVDNGGTCVPAPDACPEIFQPVCGCDGTTYANDCERRRAGAQKAHDGRCRCRVIECRPGWVARDVDGDGCPDRCIPLPP
jgi:hypothetical protein